MEKVFQVEQDARKKIFQIHNVTEKEVDSHIESLRKWLDQQPHLPSNMSRNKLELFLILNKFRIEKTKSKLDDYYTLKSVAPKYFQDNFSKDERIQNAYQNTTYFPLPKTFNLERIFVAFFNSPDPNLYDPTLFYATAYKIFDLEYEHDCVTSGIFILDLTNFTFAHAAKISLIEAKTAYTIMEKGYSGRLSSIHLVYTPPGADILLKLLKTVVSPKIAGKIYFHKSLVDLHKIIPKDYLPKNLGGDLATYADMHEMWKNILIEKSDFLEQMNSWKINEGLRPKSIISEQFSDVQGSFRQLNFD